MLGKPQFAWYAYWKNELFREHEDVTWKEWVDLKGGVIYHDLVELLKSDVLPGYKARALALIIQPDVFLGPVYAKVRDDLTDFAHLSSIELTGLPMQFVRLAADIVCESWDFLVKRPVKIEQARSIARTYQRYMLELLELLPYEEGEQVFARFRLNDLESFYNFDDASGYNPFSALIGNPKIDERWKRRVDAAMREIVLSELAGKTKPREAHEDALANYQYSVMSCSYRLPYSREFLADHLLFLTGLPVFNRVLVESMSLPGLIALFPEPGYADLRHKIARAALLAGSDPYGVHSEPHLKVAELLLKEFGSQDTELATVLTRALDEGREDVLRGMAAEADHHARAQAVAMKMRG